MIDASEEIGRFVEGRNAVDLETDRMLLFALVRALEVLGEAANGVTPETRALAPEIPWNLVVATRNRLDTSTSILRSFGRRQPSKCRSCFLVFGSYWRN
jgi:uncharacterized protein with HEPN domain